MQARDGCRIHLNAACRPPRIATPSPPAITSVRASDADAGAHAFARFAGGIAVPLRQAPYGRDIDPRDPDGDLLALVQPA